MSSIANVFFRFRPFGSAVRRRPLLPCTFHGSILAGHTNRSQGHGATAAGRNYNAINVVVNPGGQQTSVNSNNNGNGNAKKSSKHRKQRGQASYKFVDRARIRVAGGSGGRGSQSNHSIGKYKKRPDGGHGGDGGHVILVADQNEQTLGMSVHHHAAEDGKSGSGKVMHGRTGRNKIIRVPCGVVVRRVLDYDEIWDEEERVVRTLVQESVDAVGEADAEEEDAESVSAATAPLDAEENSQFEMIMDARGEQDLSSDSNDDGDNDLESNETYEEGVDDEEDVQNNEFDYDSDSDEAEQDSDSDHEEEDSGDESDDESRDYESVVNTGIKGEDGMYHWRPEGYDESSSSSEDEWVSSTSLLCNGEREKVVIADLDKPGSFVVVASGGRGGTGNSAFAKRQHKPGLLSSASAWAGGKPGEAAHLELELKLIADLGLVGFPNAGKSSLLAAMSMAKPEIAPYPFTTLHPLVGTIRYRDGFRVVAADVPGLIGGASIGRGRGFDFLRHLERTKALLYIVDAAGVDGRHPVQDLHILAEEIASYGDGDMMTRPALVVANKMDLITNEEERESILFDVAVASEEAGIAFRGDVLGISAGVTGEGLSMLSRVMRDVVLEGESNRIISEES